MTITMAFSRSHHIYLLCGLEGLGQHESLSNEVKRCDHEELEEK